jgi:hypothetical protein
MEDNHIFVIKKDEQNIMASKGTMRISDKINKFVHNKGASLSKEKLVPKSNTLMNYFKNKPSITP